MSVAPNERRIGPEVARLLIGQVFFHAPMSGARMAMALLALSEGYSKAAVGALVALFALSPIFLSLPAGRFADRHGLKRPVALCVLASSAGFLLAAVWPVYPVLCLAAVLSGGSTAVASLAMQRQLGKIAQTSEQMRAVFSWVSVAPAVAVVVGPATAGLVIDHAGFRWLFLLMAVSPVGAWLLARSARDTAQGDSKKARSAKAWDLLRSPQMRTLMILNMLMSWGWELHNFMIPVLGHDRGLSASTIGTILACSATGVLVVRFAIPLLARRVSESRLLPLAIATTGVLIMAYPFAPTVVVMCVASALIGVMVGSVQPMVLSMLHQITPPERHGEALGIRLVTVHTSAVSTPILLGAISAFAGASGVFWVVGGVVTVGSLVGRKLRAAEPPDGG